MSTDRYTQILNYLSAMSREIGMFRTETNNRLDRLESRMDGLETRMGGLETKMDGLGTRMDSLESRMGQLEAKVDAGFEKANRGIRRMSQKFDSVTEALADVSLDNRDLGKRVEVIEKKVGIEES